jgi:hypothetical protein
MTDCPNAEFRDQLPVLAAGVLAADQRAHVEAHVAECADCRDELALIATMRQSLIAATPAMDVSRIAAALPGVPGLPGLPVPSVPAVRSLTSAASARRRPRLMGWQAAAAVALLTVGGGSALVLTARHDGLGPAVASIAGSPLPVPAEPWEPAGGAVMAVRDGTPAGDNEGLALTGRIGDLTDDELAVLIAELQEFDATPPPQAGRITLPMAGAVPPEPEIVIPPAEDMA